MIHQVHHPPLLGCLPKLLPALGPNKLVRRVYIFQVNRRNLRPNFLFLLKNVAYVCQLFFWPHIFLWDRLYPTAR
uniref:Uncharacterized protein n=1 Tax=Lotus japonicus TaxID=34305 RepID=I3SI24_LOTJA|nr:unknown [Lotus japonicus]